MSQPIEVRWRTYASVNQTIIASYNGLSPARHQTIIWTNDGSFSIKSYQNSMNLKGKYNNLHTMNEFEHVVFYMADSMVEEWWNVSLCCVVVSYWPIVSPSFTLEWRHDERDRLFRRRLKTSKLRVTGLCEGNSPVKGEFPTQRASNAENVSIWWRHHE